MACLKVRNIRVCQTDPKENPCVKELILLAAAFEAFLFEGMLRNWTRFSTAVLLLKFAWGMLGGSECCGIQVPKYNLEIPHVQNAREIQGELLRIENYLQEILFSYSPPFWPCLTLFEGQFYPSPNQSYKRTTCPGEWSPEQQDQLHRSYPGIKICIWTRSPDNLEVLVYT